VQRVRRRVAQHIGAPGEVEERRDREARADEVLVVGDDGLVDAIRARVALPVSRA